MHAYLYLYTWQSKYIEINFIEMGGAQHVCIQLSNAATLI